MGFKSSHDLHILVAWFDYGFLPRVRGRARASWSLKRWARVASSNRLHEWAWFFLTNWDTSSIPRHIFTLVLSSIPPSYEVLPVTRAKNTGSMLSTPMSPGR